MCWTFQGDRVHVHICSYNVNRVRVGLQSTHRPTIGKFLLESSPMSKGTLTII